MMWWQTILSLYFLIELLFFLFFYLYLLPRANRHTPPAPYRSYEKHRHKLLLRVLNRMERTCRHLNKPLTPTLESFLYSWFDHDDTATPPKESWDDTVLDFKEKYVLKHLKRDDIDEFFGWAFFDKFYENLVPWEYEELQKIYDILKNRYNVDVKEGKCEGVKARRLTLEDVTPMHRPLILYLLFHSVKLVGYWILGYVGFRHYTSTTGLSYWYRPESSPDASKLQPFLFFHGIAPCGAFFCLPMLLSSLARDGRATFLFENKPVTHSLCLRFLDEDDTVSGVTEALSKHLPNDSKVILCGHSFGSCQLTWLLRAMPHRIGQLILIDPVSVLLSEPDVMANFLYDRNFFQSVSHFLIHCVASTEVVTEWFLRRNFAWYNGEFWLEDVPEGAKVTVCLSERDQILNAKKVRTYVEMFNEEKRKKNESQVELIYWNDVGHAHCLSEPESWEQICKVMLQHEAMMMKEEEVVGKNVTPSSSSNKFRTTLSQLSC